MKIRQSLTGLIIDIDFLKSVFFFVLLLVVFIPDNLPIINIMPTYLKVVVACLIPIIIIIIKYLSVFYIIDNDHLIIQSGLVTKTHNTIPYTKITTINFNQRLLLRLTNCYEIRIETNDTNSEYEKLVVNYENFIYIMEMEDNFNKKKENKAPSERQSSNEYKVSTSALIKFALSKINIFLSVSLIFGFYNFLNEYFSSLNIDKTVSNFFENRSSVFTSLIITIVVVMIITVAIIRNIVKYYDYSLVKYDDRYEISYGLFTRHNYTLQTKYINGVVIKQSILSKLLGICDINVVNAGYGGQDDDENDSQPYFIIALPVKQLDFFLKDMIDIFEVSNTGSKPLFKAYLPKLIINISIILLIVITCLTYKIAYSWFIVGIALIIIAYQLIATVLITNNNKLHFKDNRLYCTTINANIFSLQIKKYIVNSKSILKLDYTKGPIQRLYNVGSISINLHNDFTEETNIYLDNYSDECKNQLKQYLLNINK